MEKLLLYFSVMHNGDWDKIYKSIYEKSIVDMTKVQETCDKYKGNYITILDDMYPQSLKMVNKPPFVLYYKGNIELLSRTNVIFPIAGLELKKEQLNSIKDKLGENNLSAVVGYSSVYENDLVNTVLNNTIVVKDGGIDSTLIITEELEKKHLDAGNLILSEYPGYNLPTKDRWVASNRIKVGLSNSLLLLSSIKEKNLWNIIYETTAQAKQVYCLYDEDKRNHNNTLISNGAVGINDITEIKY